MPSKAIELASFDLYKRLLSPAPSGDRRGPGGLATSVAGGLAGDLSKSTLPTPRAHLMVAFELYF